MTTMTREKFGSRLGFLLVSAGCAIGIGNVWKFPYVTGENGGGIFVLFYLLFLLIMGLPVLTMELAVGRASRKSAVLAYQTLEKPGSFWHLHGWVAIAGCYLLMMYYTTVSGWMVSYFVKFMTGTFAGVSVEETTGVFGAMLSNPVEMTAFMALTVFAGFLVCSLGLQNGIERITKVMMLGLLMLIIVLAVHCIGLPGAMKGVSFYLKPDPAEASRVGLFNVMTAAMSQSFFTLSLGVASMEIFGSYMSKDNTLMQESFWICILDTFVALVSGLIIFPACFSFGIQPDAGPDLIFITLPKVFMSMAGGRLWGTMFFLFMTFASFSTVIAVFENLISCCIDNFGWSRKKAVTINLLFMLAASMPCVLGFNVWSSWHPIGTMDVLGSEDFIVSNILLPAGALIYLLFCTTKWGWGFDNFIAETNTGSGMKMPVWLKGYFQWILPLLIVGIFVTGLL